MIEIEPMITLPDFDAFEFDCHCCGLNNMSPVFLWKLQQARTESQVPFIINSGTRCEKHNKIVGGTINSEHLTGEAADISTSNSHIRYKIIQAAISVGFTRIGVAETFVHLGNKINRPQQVLWTY